jgi:hypothetical protein
MTEVKKYASATCMSDTMHFQANINNVRFKQTTLTVIEQLANLRISMFVLRNRLLIPIWIFGKITSNEMTPVFETVYK